MFCFSRSARPVSGREDAGFVVVAASEKAFCGTFLCLVAQCDVEMHWKGSLLVAPKRH